MVPAADLGRIFPTQQQLPRRSRATAAATTTTAVFSPEVSPLLSLMAQLRYVRYYIVLQCVDGRYFLNYTQACCIVVSYTANVLIGGSSNKGEEVAQYNVMKFRNLTSTRV